jgi:membrane protein YqaA with SNARE-associated domain
MVEDRPASAWHGRSSAEFSGRVFVTDLSTYAWMFSAALIAGTILPFLPGSSELVLAGFLAAGQGDPWILVASASMGNIIGSIINYFIGRYVSGLAGRRWFPVTEAQMERASIRFNRYGVWILLMSWLPAAGDVITIVAGFLRTDFKLFLVLISIGKFFRYFAIAVGLDLFGGTPS